MTRKRIRDKRIQKQRLSLQEFLRLPVGGVFYFFDQSDWYKPSRQAVVRLTVEESEILIGRNYAADGVEILRNIPIRSDCYEQHPVRSFFKDEQSALRWYEMYQKRRWKEWRGREKTTTKKRRTEGNGMAHHRGV